MGTTGDLLHRPGRHVDDLETHLARWEEAGIITAGQHTAISELESVPPAPPTDGAHLSLGAEVAVYLGSILALGWLGPGKSADLRA